jgi:chromate transport protein ChrA
MGALAAWAGFTLPSALVLILFAYSVASLESVLGTGWLHGLKVAAVAVVTVAVLGMARALAPDRQRATLAVAGAEVALAIPSAWGQVGAIALGGVVGMVLLRDGAPTDHVSLPLSVSRTAAAVALILFVALLIGLPLAVPVVQSPVLAYFDAFYRAGSLVFGGGHVVLPLLRAEVVPETFQFLGFVFICGRTRKGKFQLKRKTRRDRMRAKLRKIKAELRERMHQPFPEQGRWLAQVVGGFYNYHAVPTNMPALRAFRYGCCVRSRVIRPSSFRRPTCPAARCAIGRPQGLLRSG